VTPPDAVRRRNEAQASESPEGAAPAPRRRSEAPER
jgi:hypothetical protein